MIVNCVIGTSEVYFIAKETLKRGRRIYRRPILSKSIADY